MSARIMIVLGWGWLVTALFVDGLDEWGCIVVASMFFVGSFVVAAIDRRRS